MAKLSMTVQLQKNDGSQLGNPIGSGSKNTKTEAEAAIAAVIAQRVAEAQGAAQELTDAQTAFNS